MGDSDNFGSDLESDSLGSHLGASDEEVDECSAVNAVRMQPTRDLGGPEDWGRLKTLENECALQVLDDEDLYDDEVLPTTQARSALAKRRVQALLKSAQELANPFDKLVVDGDEVLTADEHNVFKVLNRVFIALCSQVHDTVKNYSYHNGNLAMGDCSTTVAYLVSPTKFPVHSATVRLVLEEFSRVMFDVTRAK